MDLRSVAIELYALAPAEFTAARNSRAKELSAAGDRELGAEVRKLARPSASAWAVNQLAERDLANEFSELGASLREAQSSADREALTRLLGRRKSLVARVTAAAGAAANAGGVALGPAAIGEVEQTFQAALADEGAFAAVFSRRMIRPIRSDGLEPADLDGALGGPRAAPSTRPRKAAAGRRSADAERAARKLAEEAVTKAEKALAEAEARLRKNRDKRDQVEHEVADVRRRLAELADRAESLDDQLSSLERERDRSADTAKRARQRREGL